MKEGLVASIATEMGPTVATAVFKAFSSPDGISTNPLSVAALYWAL